MSESRKILTIGMSDSERFELLKDRTITVPFIDTEKLAQIDADEYAALEQIGKGGALKILRKFGEEFGVFQDEYSTQDVEFKFAFSRNNLRESINKQHKQFQNYAKMMTVFIEVINNAVGIEIQGDRYKKPGSQLESMYVFISGFYNESGIIPVLLEVKTYRFETKASLYVAISLREIKRSRILAYILNAESIKPYTSPTSIAVSLADLLSNVNIEDKNLLKYVPDGFLDDAQIEAKQIALKETADYIDKKNKQRAAKSDKPADDDLFIGEPGIGYIRGDENSIIFIFRKKTA